MTKAIPGKTLSVPMDGLIGETTPLFKLPLAGLAELSLDMTKVVSINSIGVKHWIIWTLRIPKDCAVKLVCIPYVIASQIRAVAGFVTPNMKVESMRMPYACTSCGFEEIRILQRGRDFEYASSAPDLKARLPSAVPSVCTKCRATTMEPDVVLEKPFSFLD